jgi:hypothetical protein
MPKNCVMETNCGMEVKHYTFLLLAVGLGEWSALHCSHFVHSFLLDA